MVLWIRNLEWWPYWESCLFEHYNLECFDKFGIVFLKLVESHVMDLIVFSLELYHLVVSNFPDREPGVQRESPRLFLLLFFLRFLELVDYFLDGCHVALEVSEVVSRVVCEFHLVSEVLGFHGLVSSLYSFKDSF